jgi:hypothetical protein
VSYSKPTVSERLATALLIANENTKRMAVRLAKVEAALTAISLHIGLELVFENPEIEQAAKEILGMNGVEHEAVRHD